MRTRGFSLIELMVVIGIIALLSAIAFSEFSLFRRQAADRTAMADLRNILTAQEAYFLENGSYTNDVGLLDGMVVSADITVTFTSANANGWAGNTYNSKGSRTYCYDSTGSATIDPVDGLAAACP